MVILLNRDKESSPHSASTSAITEDATISEAPSPTSTPPPSTPAPQQTGSTAVVVGTCDEGGTCGVKQRTAPYTDAPRLVPNDLQDNVTVTVVCQTTGDVRTSTGHGSSSLVPARQRRLRELGLPQCPRVGDTGVLTAAQ